MKKRISPLYIGYIALMALIIAVGIFMMVYGSLHNGVPMPPVPGGARFAGAMLHG